MKLKNGFAELGMCLPPGMCQSLCNFFNEELGTPDSRHTVVNGNRALLIVHPSTNKDERMLNFIALVKHMMTEISILFQSITFWCWEQSKLS